ncbi:hypothetical protein BKA57DRAFT_466448 [Linnemannia elongata]|nr:hypothetical protein BKA57DRAFT_466448 [Linnemannia elongata]
MIRWWLGMHITFGMRWQMSVLMLIWRLIKSFCSRPFVGHSWRGAKVLMESWEGCVDVLLVKSTHTDISKASCQCRTLTFFSPFNLSLLLSCFSHRTRKG